jgi:hypothetical protein
MGIWGAEDPLDISQLEEVAMAGKPTYQKIEKRTVTEQALKDSQRLLQTVIDTIEGEVFVKDTDGKYLFGA